MVTADEHALHTMQRQFFCDLPLDGPNGSVAFLTAAVAGAWGVTAADVPAPVA